MRTISATWKEGRLFFDEQPDWPEGCRLLIRPEPDIVGMTEEDQSDDAESIARWIAEFQAIPPLPMSPEDEADMNSWRQKMKEFNIKAVQHQMEEGLL